MAKDYLIEVRVKNGYLHGKMREMGFETNVALSEKSGVDPSRISEFLNLRSYPMSRKTGEWLSGVMQLAEALDCVPEDLFPPQHLQNPLQKNKAEFELNLDEFTMLAGDDTPETLMLESETRATVHGPRRTGQTCCGESTQSESGSGAFLRGRDPTGNRRQYDALKSPTETGGGRCL